MRDTKDEMRETIAARLVELRAERDAFAASAETQAQARLEAVRQGLMVEIQVRMEMFERMIGELERLTADDGPATANVGGFS